MDCDDLANIPASELLYLARMASQMNRFPDMILYLSTYVRKEARDLTPDERNLVSSAYKGIISQFRASWRIVNSVSTQEAQAGNLVNKDRAEAYKTRIEAEMQAQINDVLELTDNFLLQRAGNAESRVFFQKLKGDFFRYLSEVRFGQEKQAAMQNASMSYKAAYDIAINELAPTNPIRLGLALNFSVFNYEILGNHHQACRMAKQAFDEGTSELANVSQESYKECSQILDLLRDNLKTWKESSKKK